MFIYVIVCSISLKIYIGQHTKENLSRYFDQKWYDAHRYVTRYSHLYNAMRKYPRESWSIYPLISGVETQAELNELEQLLIYALKSQHPDIGYNICDGGEGFHGTHSPEFRAKISIAVRKRYANGDFLSSEIRAKIGEANRQHLLGSTQSPETKAKHAESARQRQAAGTLPIGRPKGFRHSPETLAKMRASAQSRVKSSEGKQQLAAAVELSANQRRGQSHPNYTTPEGIEKMRITKSGKPWSAKRRAAHENKTFSSIE